MAMVDAASRAFKIYSNRNAGTDKRDVKMQIFVPGDGVQPVLAAALALNFTSVEYVRLVSCSAFVFPLLATLSHVFATAIPIWSSFPLIL